jgi:hypothetical protein
LDRLESKLAAGIKIVVGFIIADGRMPDGRPETRQTVPVLRALVYSDY